MPNNNNNNNKLKINKVLCFFALLLIIIISVNAEPVELWNITSGGTEQDEVYDIAVDSNNNIIVTGFTKSSGDINGDIWVIKYDEQGNVLWNKTFGGVDCDKGTGVAVDSNNNIIVTGRAIFCDFGHSFELDNYYMQFLEEGQVHIGLINGFKENNITLSNNAKITHKREGSWEIIDGNNIYVILVHNTLHVGAYKTSNLVTIKYDSGGNMLWNKSVIFKQLDRYWDVAIDLEDNIIITGDITIKYDINGNVLWNKTLTGTGIAVDSDNNIIITDTILSPDRDFSSILTAKYDSNGNMLWNKTAFGIYNDRSESTAVDSNNNIIITGSTTSIGKKVYPDECDTTIYHNDLWVIKYDPHGNMLWNKTLDGIYNNSFDSGQSVTVDKNDNIIIAGYTEHISIDKNYKTSTLDNVTYYYLDDKSIAYYINPPLARNYELRVVKYDPLGNLIWNKTKGGNDRDMGFGAAVDSDDNIIVAGITKSFGAGDSDIWVIKYRSHEDKNRIAYVIIGAIIFMLILLLIFLIKKAKIKSNNKRSK